MVHFEKDSFQTLAVLHWYWQQISKNKQETRHGTEHNQSGPVLVPIAKKEHKTRSK